jgi:hypothetical protein
MALGLLVWLWLFADCFSMAVLGRKGPACVWRWNLWTYGARPHARARHGSHRKYSLIRPLPFDWLCSDMIASGFSVQRRVVQTPSPTHSSTARMLLFQSQPDWRSLDIYIYIYKIAEGVYYVLPQGISAVPVFVIFA